MTANANPYLPPVGDGSMRARVTSPRLYAWISIGIGLAVVATMLLTRLELLSLLEAWTAPAQRGIGGEPRAAGRSDGLDGGGRLCWR